MIDTFTISHYSGPCSNVFFGTGHFEWARRSRILIASGERIRITLYGHGADLAQDATGSHIYEWISGRGTTTDYPNAPILFGGLVPKGYVTINVRAASVHGLGNRTVTVKWLTGNETLNLKIVANCNEVTSATYRTPVAPGSSGGGGGFVDVGQATPNLLPHLKTPAVLTRALGQEVMTTQGGMFQVADYFGDGLPENFVTSVPVPDLTWGVTGLNIDLANTQFDAQLIDESDQNNPRVLDSLNLPQGFPANTPLVTKDNYPGRLRTIRVVRNPRFQLGTQTTQTFQGTFTEPGSRQLLDPKRLLIIVDSNNRIDEDRRENDNALSF